MHFFFQVIVTWLSSATGWSFVSVAGCYNSLGLNAFSAANQSDWQVMANPKHQHGAHNELQCLEVKSYISVSTVYFFSPPWLTLVKSLFQVQACMHCVCDCSCMWIWQILNKLTVTAHWRCITWHLHQTANNSTTTDRQCEGEGLNRRSLLIMILKKLYYGGIASRAAMKSRHHWLSCCDNLQKTCYMQLQVPTCNAPWMHPESRGMCNWSPCVGGRTQTVHGLNAAEEGSQNYYVLV